MICPVCEHQQEFGVECEVCGKDLGGLDDLGAPPAAPQVVEGLEATIGERVGEIALDAVADLEVTTFSAGEVAVESMTDMERTENAPVGTLLAERVADMTDDRAPDDGARTAAPTGAVTCRYCRNVQAEGVICEKCGMRLPKVSAPVVAATGVKPEQSTETVRCRSCGAPAKPGQRCTDCGREVPPATA